MKMNELTKGEKRIFNELIEGFSYKEISQNLGLSIATVKSHVMSILKKTYADDSKKLIVQYYKELLKIQRFGKGADNV